MCLAQAALGLRTHRRMKKTAWPRAVNSGSTVRLREWVCDPEEGGESREQEGLAG